MQTKSVGGLNRNAVIQRQQRAAGAINRSGRGGPSVIQLAIRYVPKGGSSSSSWTKLGTTADGLYDIYEDHSDPEPISDLAMTRDAMVTLPDGDDLSDLEESDTEIDPAGSEKKPIKKVYRVNGLRDSRKLVTKVLKKSPTENVGVRIGGGGVFRVEGRTTQVFIKPVSKAKLVQSDGSQALGFEPSQITGDVDRSGGAGSYQHVFGPLSGKGVATGRALYDRFIATPPSPYPASFSPYERHLMDEGFTVLSIAEQFRTDYAVPLFVASSRALIKGAPVPEVLYKGKGQIDALHPGASSHKHSKISGQLMEQNMGFGENKPHPTQKHMSISKSDFAYGATRTKKLFAKATDSGSDYFGMLSEHMMPAFSIGARDITKLVMSERSSAFAGAVKSLRLKGGTKVTVGERVIYHKVNYTVKNVTPTGWVQLIY